MKERPILFSGEMVRAILAGTKTQTRRLAKDRHLVGDIIVSPYGVPRERLWVRETWARTPGEHPLDAGVLYRATDPGWDSEGTGLRWKPSIFMRREHSRITLQVISVRVERLNEISEDDARAEGATFHDGHGIGHSGWRHDERDVFSSARASFAHLWERINGARASWKSNPWVWVVEFKQIEAIR